MTKALDAAIDRIPSKYLKVVWLWLWSLWLPLDSLGDFRIDIERQGAGVDKYTVRKWNEVVGERVFDFTLPIADA